MLLFGLASQLAFFSLKTGAIETIMPVEADLPTRINEGKCDRQGRFVFGTKHGVEKAEKIGGFYRLNVDLSLERLPLGECAISNSIAFSPDGSAVAMVACGTRSGAAAAWCVMTPAAAKQRASRCRQRSQAVSRSVVPPNVTSFEREPLGTVYITSARVGLDAGALQDDPHAGAVFIATPPARGIAEPVFRGHNRGY